MNSSAVQGILRQLMYQRGSRSHGSVIKRWMGEKGTEEILRPETHHTVFKVELVGMCMGTELI
jgi:hypothetical protein